MTTSGKVRERRAQPEDGKVNPRTTAGNRWGVAYAGAADFETAVEAVEAASTEAGLRCERHSTGGGALAIHAVQERPWYRVLLEAAPQKIDWRLEPSDEGISITADFRPFRWYAAVLTLLTLLIAGLLAAGLLSAGRTWPPEQAWIPQTLQGLFFAALALSIVPVILLGALGGGRQVQAIWQPVLRCVEKAGGRLEPQDRTVSRRYTFAVLIYTGIFLATVGLPLYETLKGPTILFAAFLLILLLAIAQMFRGAAYMLRSEALLGGLVSVSCAVLYLGLPSLTAPLAPVSEEFLARAAVLQQRSENARTVATEVALELASLRRFVRGLGISAATVVTLLFTALLLYGARLTLSAWVTVWRMHDQSGRGIWNQAVRGPSVLRRFRWAFVTLWGLSTILVFVALLFNGLCALQSFVSFSSRPELRLVELSAGYVALALGRPLGDPATASAVRAAWLLYSLSGPALLAVSVGQLARSQRRERRQLRRAPTHAELQRTVDRLSVQNVGPRIRLVALETSEVVASSVVFGLRRPERFIVVSSGCLDVLERDDLEAAIAHELAHHLEGHCRVDQLLRWLGRLTLVGDGFALLMQNSWGYEEAADRAAVEKLGVPRETLVRCLQKMRHLQAMTRLLPARLPPPRLGLFSGLPALSDNLKEIEELLEKGPSALPFRRRWTLAWQILHEQYFDALSLYYWHPTDRIRKQTIRSL